MLTPSELARRLDQRFRILAGGQRGVVERHQTLRAAIDWSYELLGEAEQVLLSRLSVFVGGFSLEAAEAVIAGGPIDADQVFELLAALVARSLVIAGTEGVDTRYRLLETIRQYAQEHLDDSGEADRLHTAHAVYYASFGEVAVLNTAAREGGDWEHRLEREFDNIGAALRWAVETQDVDTAVRLFGMWSAPTFVTDVSLLATVRWASDIVLAMPGASEHPYYPAALSVTAAGAWARADQDLAARRCDEAVAAEQRLGSEPSIHVWVVRTNVALAQGHPEEALEYSNRAVALSRARGEPSWLAWSLSMSALVHAMLGDPTAALPEAEEVVTLTRQLPGTQIARGTLGMAAFALGDSEPERALALASEVVASILPREHSPSWAIAGDLAARHGDQRDAFAFFAKAIEDSHWLSNRPAVGTVIGRVADLLAESDPEATAVLQGSGDALAPGYTHAPHTIEARQQAITTLDTSLGVARREELYRQGKAMTDDEAVAYALAAINRRLQNGSVRQRNQHAAG